MERVKIAFIAYDSSILDHVWIHQYAVYSAILRQFGGDQYGRITHKWRRKQSIVDLSIEIDAYNASVACVDRFN